jgi:haloalkane dehalogenase
VPKLFLKAEPGAILANNTLVNLVRGWPALTEKTVSDDDTCEELIGDRALARRVHEWLGLSSFAKEKQTISAAMATGQNCP